MKKISIIIPVYNEVRLFEKVYDNLMKFKPIDSIDKELIIIDDYSTDGTRELIKKIDSVNVITIFNDKNYGKGYAVRKGIEKMSGDFFVIHDADLEYNTSEINKLLKIAINTEADVVYGSRFLSGEFKRVLFFWHTVGNKFLTTLSNIFSDLNFTDMETCFKLIKKDIVQNFTLEENRFGFEPEITAKIGKLNKIKNLKIYEIGISYNGRTYSEGKKINWKDGFAAIKSIIKYNF